MGRLKLPQHINPAFLLGAAVGAGVFALFWFALGRGGGSAPSIQVSNGAPAVFAYLDDLHIASYLAQLQGGAANTEVLSQQLTQTRNASIGANGASAGLSASEQSAVQLSLTVNDQARFSDLLGVLQHHSFLHRIDMAQSDAKVRHQFVPVTAGSFVELTNCTLHLPSYVDAERIARAQLARAAKGQKPITNSYHPQSATRQAFKDRQHAQDLPPGQVPVAEPAIQTATFPPDQLAQANLQMTRLVRNAGSDPRVPLSSCSPGGYDPYVPDLLMPIRLGDLTSDVSVLSGQVNLIGKVMLAIRGRLHMDDPGKHESYVDLASIQQWQGARLWTSGPNGLIDEATVLGPGYVIQPLAIYK